MSQGAAPELSLHDFEPEAEVFRREVFEGLAKSQKQLHCKYLYDERGSQLFDAICETEDYYPTRTELAIMETYVDDMAQLLGPGCLLIEYGSGSSLKTRILLDRLRELAGYVPIDISRDHLMKAADIIRQQYPDIPVLPVCADYTEGEFVLPDCPKPVNRRVVYFPGSTIGNFDRDVAKRFLARMKKVCGAHGAVLLGVDLKKDPHILEAAYDDSEGVTAAFNLNILHRINRELGANFDVHNFVHRAIYNPERGRMEMYLESQVDQTVRFPDREFSFAKGERIHTENSHKYSLDEFRALAENLGYRVAKVWTDPNDLFSVQCLDVD